MVIVLFLRLMSPAWRFQSSEQREALGAKQGVAYVEVPLQSALDGVCAGKALKCVYGFAAVG
jgi:hypothetical protein